MGGPLPCPATLGVVLAGGRGLRMGGVDKALVQLGGETVLHRIVRCLAPQCVGLIVNANGDPGRFGGLGLPVVPDPVPGHPGPLAGVLAALDWAAAQRPDATWVASVSGDTPFLPPDLVERLHRARAAMESPLACAASAGRPHPTVGLWPVGLRHDLRRTLEQEDLRSVRQWASRYGVAQASWPEGPVDPFFNINTPEDLAAARVLLENLPPPLQRRP